MSKSSTAILLLIISGFCKGEEELRGWLPEFCVFGEQKCPNSRISFWLYTKWVDFSTEL